MRAIICIGIATLLAAVAQSGSLTPPGAPAPTMKTLDDVEPRTPIRAADIPLAINEPGSYYLAENITYPTINSTCIVVYSTGVTIDLNGFTLEGPGSGSGTVGNAIRTPASVDTITIKNGVVRGWAGDGLSLGQADGASVESIVAIGNGGNGITAREASIRNCRAEGNGESGISIFDGTAAGNFCAENGDAGITAASGNFQNNQCFDNDENGIKTGSKSVVKNNQCDENGFDGIQTMDDCQIEDNQCDGNGQRGIWAENNCIIKSNKCSSNVGNGIHAALSCRVEKNSVNGNLNGIDANSFSIVINNTASGNTNIHYISSGVPGPNFGPTQSLAGGGLVTATSPWANFVH